MTAPDNQGTARYFFDDVTVERENFRVLKAGQARELEPRVFDLLIFLIERRGRVLEKQEIFEQVWKDAYVTDNALTRAVKEIRRAIGDDASAPRYIETVPKRGYRFIAEVKEAELPEPAESVAPEAEQNPALKREERVESFNYRIVRKIGAGGMGEVFLAEDTRLDRKVALKLLPDHLTNDESRLRRFIREAKAASALNHPNIITIHEIVQERSGYYIATEYIEGQTLRRLMQAEPLNLLAALDIAVQIASALAAVHEAGIMHRDIKPENVMVRPDGLVKVLDFGLAKLIEKRQAPESPAVNADMVDEQTVSLSDYYATNRDPLMTTPDPTLGSTAAGIILGTVTYMSPEQLRGQQIDARTDIFSLGVLFYEVIAGRSPFAGSTRADVIAAVLGREPAPLTEPEAPPALERIVSKALRKNRDERYQTTRELLDELKELKQELEFQAKLERAFPADVKESESASTQSSQSISRKFEPIALLGNYRISIPLATGLLIIVATAIWFYWRSANLAWAREQIPRIEGLVKLQKYFEAYDLATRTQEYLPDDPVIARLMPAISDAISVTTEPAGATVFLKRFKPDAAGKSPPREKVGTTPINGLRVARGEYILYIEKEGYAPVERSVSSLLTPVGNAMLPPDEPNVFEQKLLEIDKIPDRMVRVPGGRYRLVSWRRPSEQTAQLSEYFMVN
jgi:serine/threonine protein kinase